MSDKTISALWQASLQGTLPVVCDASSCTEGLMSLCAEQPGLEVIDSVAFVTDKVLPRLDNLTKVESVAVHPTCSSTRMGTNDALLALASAVAFDVQVPVNWGCCAFAGDRGLLHPELTASATADEAREVNGREHSAYVSCNRTCELGMTRATGKDYRNVLELLEQATRPPTEKENRR